jgi:hypothetical protein
MFLTEFLLLFETRICVLTTLVIVTVIKLRAKDKILAQKKVPYE